MKAAWVEPTISLVRGSVSYARLKLSGAWWLEENGNDMLRIRCAIYNGTFDTVFKSYVENRNREIQSW
jgi:hypothetical protein